MRRTLFIHFLFLIPLAILAQGTILQNGVTYRYNGKKPRTLLGKVYIKVATAPNGVISDSTNGTFTLTFSGMPMGSRIGNVQVQKRGMMIFNQQAVDEWSIRKEPLRLILCDADEFEKQKQNLIAIGQREAKKRYDKKIAEIEAKYQAESAEWYQKLSEADEELQNTRKHLSEYADALARIDQSELDAQMQEVIDLYEQGEVQKAMQKLENMHLAEKFNQALERKHIHKQGLEAATQDSTLLIEKIRSSITLYQNSGEYGKAAEYLKLLADKLNTPEDIFDYAHFCAKQNIFTDAISYYQKALSLYREKSINSPNYRPDMAATLNNLANLYSNTQRFEESEAMYRKALEIRRRLAAANPQAYEPDVASTLNNLANLYKNTLRFEESEAMYREALEIHRRLAAANPQAYEPYVAATLNNLATLYSDTQRLDESETMYKEALEIRRRLAASNPQAYEPDVAQTLNNLALLYYNTQRFEESEAMYREALEIRRRLAAANPQAYEPDVAMTLNNLALLCSNIWYSNTQRLEESEAMYKEALEIRRRLAAANPQTYEPDVAMTLNNLAILYSNTQRLEESEAMYRKALETYLHLAAANPQAYERNVAATLNGLTILYNNTRCLEEREAMYKEALEIRRRLAASNPQVYEPDVARTLHNLALLYSKAQRFTEGEAMYKEALEILRRLAAANPQAYEPDLAQTLNDLALLYYNTQRFEESEAMYKEALEIRRRLAASNPQAYEFDVAQTQYNMGSLKVSMEQYSEAIAPFEEALDIYRRLSKTNPAQQQWYESSLYSLSLLYHIEENYLAAYNINHEWLPIMKKLYETDMDTQRNNYAGNLGSQSFYAIFAKQYTEAELYARDGLAIDSTKHFIYSNLAASLLFQGKYAEAETIYRQFKDELKDSFLDDFKQFAEAGVIPEERKEDVERIKQMLNEP